MRHRWTDPVSDVAICTLCGLRRVYSARNLKRPVQGHYERVGSVLDKAGPCPGGAVADAPVGAPLAPFLRSGADGDDEGRLSARAEAVRERLAERLLPGGERSWIDLAVDAARGAGCSVDDILGDSRMSSAVRGRHAWWAALRREGYSYPEIADGVGADHSTVFAALKKLRARGDRHAGPPVGFASMGTGAGI